MRMLMVSFACVLSAACGREDAPVATAPPTLHAVAPSAPQPGDPVEGLRVARRVGCTGCHGDDATGRDLWEMPGVKIRSANLTQKHALYDDAGLDALLTQGRTHDGHKPLGMPVFMFQRLSDHERRDIIAWVRTLAPAPHPGLQPTSMTAEIRKQVEDGTYEVDDHLPDPGVVAPTERPTETLALGEYLAMTSCPECHGRDLRGWGPDDPAPSLVVAKAYTPQAFKRLMREGITASGGPSKTGFMTGVAKDRFAPMSDLEIDALKAFLDARAP